MFEGRNERSSERTRRQITELKPNPSRALKALGESGIKGAGLTLQKERRDKKPVFEWRGEV